MRARSAPSGQRSRRGRRSRRPSPTRAAAGCVTPTRTSVTMMAWSHLVGLARRGRRACSRAARRRPMRRSSRAPTRHRARRAERAEHRRADARVDGNGHRRERRPRVQTTGVPGNTVHAGDEQRQRRRRAQAAAEIVEDLPSRDERQPVARDAADRVGTTGSSHHRICQSPRTQRCCRCAWARTLDG